MHLPWASCYEGSSDRAYFDILLPRVMEEITLADGVRPVVIPISPALYIGRSNREVNAVADEICVNKECFHLLFIHTDSGGRGVVARVEQRGEAYCGSAQNQCHWPPERCVVIVPRHETEAWVLSDPVAVLDALGFRGRPEDLRLPADAMEAERLVDPKATLDEALRMVRHRRAYRGSSDLFTTIAQRQSIDQLRRSTSFQEFETKLRRGLSSLGCVRR